ncbi:MAG TPA: [Fe-Fe] hydrogenase large subunit C-terminal domain-containing protein [bacterium]|nr:[Fe-Fe] hydrogenase large subunit C-terminal domain-containing protein [bacterium]HQI49691.1 [Fe-Fe] hydrogenase large subunit C-terminal domain-containing protein [bacterium]HQJ65859.1 [Fe-Fe] hydrogenase large subunit C-terminal domain-containing protein [bacterium]
MDPIVTTIENRCKRCYLCVRRCPAKAIRVENGQAKVMAERCITCGYCARVCPQGAKRIRDGTVHTRELLASGRETIALLAPSFPAAFTDGRPLQVVAGLRQIGFSRVYEVALGADLVGAEYARLRETGIMPIIITSPCPAVVNFIEKYYPELLLILAPVVSPMIALARLIRTQWHPDAHIVFIGPCIAKKREMEDPKTGGVIQEVLTFQELAALFRDGQIVLNKLPDSPLDGPEAGIGRAFAISGGLLDTAGIPGGTLQNKVIVTEGRDRVLEAIRKVADGNIEAQFLDLLFCEGCINGPQMDNELSVFIRKDRVVHFLHHSEENEPFEKREHWSKKIKPVDLSRDFTWEEISLPLPSEEELAEILAITGKLTPEDELNCGACGYPSCREKAIAVYQGIAEAGMCLPYLIDQLQKTESELTASNVELKHSLETLRKTQAQLLQSEKMASVGQLAAGVAHELNNPLGGILIYTSLLLEKSARDAQETQDLELIRAETERCKKIVRGLLDFSRQTRIEAAIVDLNQILGSTLALVTQQAIFHNIKVEKELDPSLPKVFVDVGQIQQVLLNIILNAVEAMQDRGTLTIKTLHDAERKQVLLRIRDTGSGMTPQVREKIFEPFFTTKPRGVGTGLGLSIAYGIMQRHKGDILVQSAPGEGSEFTLVLPEGEEMVLADAELAGITQS